MNSSAVSEARKARSSIPCCRAQDAAQFSTRKDADLEGKCRLRVNAGGLACLCPIGWWHSTVVLVGQSKYNKLRHRWSALPPMLAAARAQPAKWLKMAASMTEEPNPTLNWFCWVSLP